MKKIFLILISAMLVITSCDKTDFEEAYPNPAKISVSLACFGFSEIEQAREYLDSAQKLLGLPKAILKNGQIEEIEDFMGE